MSAARLDASERLLPKVEGDIIYTDFAPTLARRDYDVGARPRARARSSQYEQGGEFDVFGAEEPRQRIREGAMRDGDKLKASAVIALDEGRDAAESERLLEQAVRSTSGRAPTSRSAA